MVAARSGVQNIAEGSQASGTSKKTELKLTNVARASLEELRLDYEDFLRQRGLPICEREDQRRAHLIARRCGDADAVAQWVKEVRNGGCKNDELHGRSGLHGRDGQSPVSMKSTSSTQSTSSIQSPSHSTYPEIAANAVLVLITVACSLLDRQIAAQSGAFEQEGGFTERLYRMRTARRRR